MYRSNKDLKLLLHPFAFVLKGGKEINKNLLDYKLYILQMSCPETIKSPPYARKIFTKPEVRSAKLTKLPLPRKKATRDKNENWQSQR